MVSQLLKEESKMSENDPLLSLDRLPTEVLQVIAGFADDATAQSIMGTCRSLRAAGQRAMESFVK